VRGVTNPANDFRPSRLISAWPVSWLVAAGVGATALAVLGGAFSSPLLALPALWLFAIRGGPLERHSIKVLAGVFAALALPELIAGTPGRLELAGAVALVGAFMAGRLRGDQRDARLERLEAEMEAIRSETGRPAASSPEARALRTLEAVQEALVSAAKSARAERAALWDADVEARRLRARTASDGVDSTDWLPLTGSPLGWLAEEGQPLRFQARPPLAARLANILALRLTREGSRAVILTLEYGPDAAVPEPEHVTRIAADVIHLLDNLEERDAHVGYRSLVSILLDTMNRMPGSIEPDIFARELLHDACRLTGADGGVLALWDDDTGRVLALEGETGGPPANATFGPVDSELAVAARAGAVFVHELTTKRISAPNIIAPGERWSRRPRYLLAVPLAAEGVTLAVLGAWSNTAPDPRGVELLHGLIPFAGLQLARSLEFGRVRASAERDALTGLPNRAAFERALTHERQRFERYHHPVALLVCDVDHFKEVNDTHGHEAGDAVLRALADTLRHEIRDVDTLARFGGEEFVVLLPETVLQAAADVAERLRVSVEALAVSWHGTLIPTTVSIGVSECPHCAARPEDLLRSADAALYSAKGAGRNRVIAAPAITARRTPGRPARRP